MSDQELTLQELLYGPPCVAPPETITAVRIWFGRTVRPEQPDLVIPITPELPNTDEGRKEAMRQIREWLEKS